MAFDRAADALAEFKKRVPDLIVSDIGLPVMNGHEFIRQVRAAETNPVERPTPAVALTAYADEGNRRRAVINGFQKCLTKPIEPRQLIAALSALKAAGGKTA